MGQFSHIWHNLRNLVWQPDSAGVRRASRRQHCGRGLEPLEPRVMLNADATNLRITEINYNPYMALLQFGEFDVNNDRFEFVELMNISNEPIELAGVQFTEIELDLDRQGINFTFAAQTLGPDERIVIVRDRPAFESRYGTNVRIADGTDGLGGPHGQYIGGLSNDGEVLTLLDATAAILQQFEFNDAGGWPGRADGNGSSLEVRDVNGDYNDFDNWTSSDQFAGSPSEPSSTLTESIVVNEILAHTDFPELDSVELFNPTDQPIDIGRWFLSDNSQNYFKYRFPLNTIIGSGEFLVINEDDFNPTMGADPNDFSFSSAHGDDLWLLSADIGGRPTLFVEHLDFAATSNGESLGRWPTFDDAFYPMRETTFGAPNAGPRIGPVVISEIMYNPPASDTGFLDDSLEFLEIYNPTELPIDLTEWQMGRGVDFAFSPGETLPAYQPLVLIPFNPVDPLNQDLLNTFRTVYEIDETVNLYGPWLGKLDNGGETVELWRPDEPPLGEPDFYPRLLEDEVKYFDTAPWPVEADNQGASLQRVSEIEWGNDSNNWIASTPTPGSVPFNPFPWHNSTTAEDVSGDGTIAPNDVFLVARHIVFEGAGPLSPPSTNNSPPPYVDVNGDNFVAATDVFLVANHIVSLRNSQQAISVAQAGSAAAHSLALVSEESITDSQFSQQDNHVQFQLSSDIAVDTQPIVVDPAAVDLIFNQHTTKGFSGHSSPKRDSFSADDDNLL